MVDLNNKVICYINGPKINGSKVEITVNYILDSGLEGTTTVGINESISFQDLMDFEIMEQIESETNEMVSSVEVKHIKIN